MKTKDIVVGQDYVWRRGNYDPIQRVTVTGFVVPERRWSGSGNTDTVAITLTDEVADKGRYIVKKLPPRPDTAMSWHKYPGDEEVTRPATILCPWDQEWLDVLAYHRDKKLAREARTAAEVAEKLPEIEKVLDVLDAAGLTFHPTAEALAEDRAPTLTFGVSAIGDLIEYVRSNL